MAKHRKLVDKAHAVDRISELPDSLCHEILRHLPATDAIITCLLSRRWRLIWYSCPFYNFDGHIFRSSVFNHMSFPKFVRDTLQLHERYFKDSKIQFLRLSMLHDFDYSLKLARKLNVKELHLDCVGFLPRHVLISKSITVLKLRCCTIASSYSINMPALQTLDLASVNMSDGGLETFLSNCPSIENLSLFKIRRSLSVNISSHKLKSLLLKSILRRATIEAPNLEILEFMNFEHPVQLDIASSTRLKFLSLCSTECLSDDVLDDLILQNPHLEKLELRDCFGLDHTSIRSQSLGHLTLHNCRNIIELNIDAPQLQILGLTSSLKLLELTINASHLRRFTYEGNLMSLSGLNSSHLFESEINLCCSNSCGLWYIKLKQLLEKFEHCRVLTLKSLEDKQLVVPGAMRESLPFRLYGLENLKVNIQKSTMNYSELLDGLRWCFPRLKTLEIEISNPVGVYYKYWQTAGDVGTESIWRYMGFF